MEIHQFIHSCNNKKNTHHSTPCPLCSSVVSLFFSVPYQVLMNISNLSKVLSWICYPSVYHTEAEYLSKWYTTPRSVHLISTSLRLFPLLQRYHPQTPRPRRLDNYRVCFRLPGLIQAGWKDSHILIAVDWWFKIRLALYTHKQIQKMI